MNANLEWFEQFRHSDSYRFLVSRPVAYFCAEFALSDTIPTFAGGLGILAGDMVREASDRNFPMVGIGLYYHEGYVCSEIDEKGVIIEHSIPVKPSEGGLSPVVDNNQNRVIIDVPIQDRVIRAQGWKWQRGSVSVYLLDTDISENAPMDQKITHRLYDVDKETRLKQEMVLGIGGVRFLEAIGVHPSIYHMNEGHSAMLVLDLIRHEMVERKIGFTDAKNRMSKHIVFTNHTLVPAGDELFSNDLASVLLSSYADEITVPIKDLIELGIVQESSIFSMTMLSLRLAAKINAVSLLHQKKARELWTDHAMDVVTNGIHIPSWDAIDSADALWDEHQANKRKLLSYIEKVSGIHFGERDLLLGWARRIVPYKRPLVLFEDLKRFRNLATQIDRPIRVVMAGKAPPGDIKAAQLLGSLQRIVSEELKGLVVCLPNHNMELAQLLTSGCDVWLNTPVVGFEACGTSGMKAALNGVLPATTKDGWVSEVELFGIGWILNSDTIHESILDALEHQIVPMYFQNDANGRPADWIRHMKNARDLILSEFSATRMLRAYIETMYVRALEDVRRE